MENTRSERETTESSSQVQQDALGPWAQLVEDASRRGEELLANAARAQKTGVEQLTAVSEELGRLGRESAGVLTSMTSAWCDLAIEGVRTSRELWTTNWLSTRSR